MKEIYNPIPAEKRWEISAGQADEVPFAYELAIRRALPIRTKELDDEIRDMWKKIGKRRGLEAKEACSRPGNSIEVAESLTAFTNSIFGREFGYEIRPGRGDSAFAVAMKCPLMEKSRECLKESYTARNICSNYIASAVEGINPDYSVNYEKQMCNGDGKCVMKIEKKSLGIKS